MPAEIDLFGEPVIGPIPCVGVTGKRQPTKRKGYAAPPGSGPEGETCRSCRHYARVSHAKVYLKCALMYPHWTNGQGTDILGKSPACRLWEKY